MRAAISIILAATLVTVLVTHVLAQAGQQAQSIVTTDSTATPPGRIGIPEPEGKGVLLWLAGDPTPVVADSLMYRPPYRRVSTAGWVAIVVGAVVVAVGIWVVSVMNSPGY